MDVLQRTVTRGWKWGRGEGRPQIPQRPHLPVRLSLKRRPCEFQGTSPLGVANSLMVLRVGGSLSTLLSDCHHTDHVCVLSPLPPLPCPQRQQPPLHSTWGSPPLLLESVLWGEQRPAHQEVWSFVLILITNSITLEVPSSLCFLGSLRNHLETRDPRQFELCLVQDCEWGVCVFPRAQDLAFHP